MTEIKRTCDVARVLVLGKSGVGKSSLIKCVFQIKDSRPTRLPEAAEYQPGVCNIDEELYSEENDFLRFHDSQGYEGGEVNNLNILIKFITEHSGSEVDVKKKIHVVWHCIATPKAGGRLLEVGDEKIFTLCKERNIPIIIVFTQYDELVVQKRYGLAEPHSDWSPQQLDKQANIDAELDFRTICSPLIKQAKRLHIPCLRASVMEGYQSTVMGVVDTTLFLIDPAQFSEPGSSKHSQRIRGSLLDDIRSLFRRKERANQTPQEITEATAAGVMMASAQRVTAEAKITASITVGEMKYWRGLSSATKFLGRNLEGCLLVIHGDIVAVWNIAGEAKDHVEGSSFMADMSRIVDELHDKKGQSPNSKVLGNVTKVAGVVGATVAVVAGAVNPAAAVTIPILVGVVFAMWVRDVYKATPPVIRCFMAYIIGLTVIMHGLFMKGGPVSNEDVTAEVEKYEKGPRSAIHGKIKRFVQDTGVIGAIANKDVVLSELKGLIREYTAVVPVNSE